MSGAQWKGDRQVPELISGKVGKQKKFSSAYQTKYTVMVSTNKYHCDQTFRTYFGGWVGCSPVRRGCAPRFFFWWFFVDFWDINFGLEKQPENSWKYWELRGRETQLLGAVSSRGKDLCVEVPPNNCHGPVRSFWTVTNACSPWPCT